MNYFDFLTYSQPISSMRSVRVRLGFLLSAIFFSLTTKSSSSLNVCGFLGMGVNERFRFLNGGMTSVCKNIPRNHFEDFTVLPDCSTVAVFSNGNEKPFVLDFGVNYLFFHTSNVHTTYIQYNSFNIF